MVGTFEIVLRVWGHAPQLSEIMSLARYSPSTRRWTNSGILARDTRFGNSSEAIWWIFGKIACLAG